MTATIRDQRGAHLPGGQGYIPEFMERERQLQTHLAYGYSPNQDENDRPISGVLYNLLWPVGSWIFVMLNGSLFLTMVWGMFTNYDPIKHAAGSVIGILSLGACAVIKRWVVDAPAGPPTMHRPQA